MSWTAEQEAFIEKIAYKAADAVLRRSQASIRETARQEAREEVLIHVRSCPVKAQMEISMLKMLLYLTGAGTVGGSIATGIIKFMG